MVEAEKTIGGHELYRGSHYSVMIQGGYRDGGYHRVDYISASSVSNKEYFSGANWFILGDFLLPIVTDLKYSTEEGFINLLNQASPEEIDEVAGWIKEGEEWISNLGYVDA